MFAAFALALVALAPRQQAPTVNAVLSDDRITVGSATVLQIVVETQTGAPERIRLPDIPAGLTVTQTSDFTQTQIGFPGGRSVVHRRDVVLRAERPGTYTIPAVEVTLDGTAYRTRPLQLLVRPGAGPRGLGVPGGTTAGSAELIVAVEPDTLYVGEAMLLEAVAYFPEALRVRSARAPAFEPPPVTGFWVQDVDDATTLAVRLRNDRIFDVQEFRRLYFPITAGTYTLAPARLIYESRAGFLFSPETHELYSDSIAVHVRPLPAEGQPASFTGAVGSFAVHAGLQPETLAPGDAATLTIDVTGTGNIKALPAPALPEIPGVDLHVAGQDVDFTALSTGVTGTKRFRWVLVPREAGTIHVPSIEYAWFDPATERYQVDRTDSLALVVSGSAVAQRTEPDTALRAIRDAAAHAPARWTRSSWFGALQLAPALLLGVLLLRNRFNAPGVSARAAARRRAARLAPLRDGSLARSEFFSALDAAIAASLAELSPERAAALRATPAWAEYDSALQRARFRPGDVGQTERRELVKRAEEIFAEAKSTRRHALAALATIALIQGEAGQFEHGVRAYEAGAYADARTAFTSYVRAQPQDASGWYNLGNAAFGNGERGVAVHSWAHALHRTPRAADARHNLRAVGAGDVVRAVAPIPLHANEMLLLASAFWLTGGSWLAFAIAQRSRRRAWTAAALLTPVALVLLLYGGTQSRPARAVIVHGGAVVHVAPQLRAERRARLEPGALVTVVDARAGWLRVRSGAHDGWIEERTVGRLPA